MAAVTFAGKVRLVLADAIRVGLGGGFRHSGVTFQHPGVLLDQERAAEIVERVIAALARRGHRRKTLLALLARIDVRVFHARGPEAARIDVDARWTGGIRDRGRVLMRRTEDWPDRLGRALISLLLLDLEPGTKPDDVPVNVTDEVAGG